MSYLDRLKEQFDERVRRAKWQMHFADWCADNGIIGEPSGRDFDRATAYADEVINETL